MLIWLVVWLPSILFSHMNWVSMIIPNPNWRVAIFFRGVARNHQPVHSCYYWILLVFTTPRTRNTIVTTSHRIHVNGRLMLTWLGYIDGKCDTIYTIHTDPMGSKTINVTNRLEVLNSHLQYSIPWYATPQWWSCQSCFRWSRHTRWCPPSYNLVYNPPLTIVISTISHIVLELCSPT